MQTLTVLRPNDIARLKAVNSGFKIHYKSKARLEKLGLIQKDFFSGEFTLTPDGIEAVSKTRNG